MILCQGLILWTPPLVEHYLAISGLYACDGADYVHSSFGCYFTVFVMDYGILGFFWLILAVGSLKFRDDISCVFSLII